MENYDLSWSSKNLSVRFFPFRELTPYWGLSRNGWLWRLKCTSRSDRLAAKLKGLRIYLRNNLAEKTTKILKRVKAVVRGWVNYHAISDNAPRVSSFIQASKRILFWWINRKGGKKRMNWQRFTALLHRIEYPKYQKLTSMLSGANPSVVSGA